MFTQDHHGIVPWESLDVAEVETARFELNCYRTRIGRSEALSDATTERVTQGGAA